MYAAILDPLTVQARVSTACLASYRIMSTHPFLLGNRLPVKEECSLTPCIVRGTIPEELREGMYVRNGGNSSVTPSEDYHL